MDRVDSINQKLEVYQSVTSFLNKQTQVFNGDKKNSLILARDLLYNVHRIYTQELVVAKSSNRFATLTTNPKFAELQRQHAARRSSTHGGSSHQSDVPFKTAMVSIPLEERATCSKYLTGVIPKEILRSTSYESKRKVASFTTDDVPQQVSMDKESKAEHHKVMGKQLMVAGLYGPAMTEYTKAIALNPNNPGYLYERAVAYSILNKHILCVPDLERAIELDPSYGVAYGALAMEYQLLGMLRKAKATFEKAMIFEPRNELFVTCLAEVNKELNARNAQAEKPGLPVVEPSTSARLEYKKPQYDTSMVKAAKQLLQNPGARNIVAAMFETHTVEENVVIELFLHIRKDIDPTRFETVYKYPLEHTLEEYDPASKKRKRKQQSK